LRFFGCIPCFAFLLLLLPTQTISAQTSVYGAVAATDFCLSRPSTSCASDTFGLLGGGYYNFPIQSRLTAGIDGRVSYGIGTRGGASVTSALRIGFVPRQNRLRPYFQIGGGVVSEHGNFDLLLRRKTNGAFHLAFGLDIRLTDAIDLRALEIGAASGAGTSLNPAAGTSYVDAGLVFHLAPRKS
jgi:hypothetical protein